MKPDPDNSDSPSPLQSYLELLRLPNVFTAAADVAMGFFFVRAAWAFNDDFPPALVPVAYWTLGLLIASSAALYLAGMVLNDVFDIDLDREEQPYRPLPSGRISLRAARWLGWNLLTLGVVLAATASILLNQFPPAKIANFFIAWRPALVAAGLAALVVLYNTGLKRTLLGPIAMGKRRALNVLLGMSVLRESWRMEHGIVAAGVGIYIAGVTWFARDDARRSQRRQLVAAALVMLVGVGVIGALPWLSKDIARMWQLHLELRMPQLAQWCWLMVLLAGFVIARTAPAIAEPSPGPVRAAVGRSITALIFLDAAACYAGAGTTDAIAIAVLVLPTAIVGRWVAAG